MPPDREEVPLRFFGRLGSVPLPGGSFNGETITEIPPGARYHPIDDDGAPLEWTGEKWERVRPRVSHIRHPRLTESAQAVFEADRDPDELREADT